MTDYVTVKCQKYAIENSGITYEYLLGAENPRKLKSVSDAPSFRTDTPNFEIASEVLIPPTKHWQRPLIQRKVLAIASRFDLPGEIMPNPVLLAMNPQSTIHIKKEIHTNGMETGFWIVKIPIPESNDVAKPLWIIDGQHRMSGLAETHGENKTLPFVLLYSEQGVYLPGVLAKIFAQVTTEATPLEEIHKAWMQFVFELGDYRKGGKEWRAMKATALLCRTQSFDRNKKPNPFYDKIQFNPELLPSPINAGGFAYNAKDLQDLFKDYFFQYEGGDYIDMTEEDFAQEISLAVIALINVAKGDPSESAFFGDSSHEQKYFRDGFIAGVCSYLYEFGIPDNWVKILKELRFHETDWDISSWVESTGGRAGTTSKRLAFNCFAEIFSEGALPDGVESICHYLQGQNSYLDIEYTLADENEKLIKSSKEVRTIDLTGGVERVPLRVPSNTRLIKITSNCKNAGAVTFSRADKPFDADYDFSSFKKGKVFSSKEVKALKNKLQLNVKVELYGNLATKKSLMINFDD